MLVFLRIVIPILGAAIGALILFVLLREGIRSFKRWRWRKRVERCRALVGKLDTLTSDDLIDIAHRLQKAFPLNLIEAVLEEYRATELTDSARKKLAEMYDRLGIIEIHIRQLQDARSWPERATAAEILGEIGHVRSVVPLLSVLQDPQEDREVKSVVLRALGKIRDPRAIAPLVETLGRPDPITGQPLADALIHFGDAIFDPIVEALAGSRREMQRYWAARILGQLQTPKAASPLIATLTDHSSKVRAEAAHALGYLGLHEAVSPLSGILLEDPVALVRDAAAEALGKIADDRALSALTEALRDVDYAARRKAMEALEKVGERAIPYFMEALRGDSSEARAQAASALERLGAVEKEIERLGTSEWNEANDFLTHIAEAGVIETIARSLSHNVLVVRIRLCRILAHSKSSRAYEALADMAQKDGEWAGRLEALQTLVKLGDQRASPLFAAALVEEEETVRERLLAALQDAPRSILSHLTDAIANLLEDRNIGVRAKAVSVLDKLGSENLLPLFLASVSDADAGVRAATAKALRRFPKESAVAALENLLADPAHGVRMQAIQSLGDLKNPRSIPPLAQTFEFADDEMRAEIARALSAMPREAFYELADVLMGLSHPKARAGVAQTLGMMGDTFAVKLLAMFLSDSEVIVRKSAAQALGGFGGSEVARVCLNALTDPNEEVRAAAVDAIARTKDIQCLPHLLPLLEGEPDRAVARKIIIALGILFEEESEFQSERGEIIRRVRKWFGDAFNVEEQAAGMISLALLKDETTFQKILQGIQEGALRKAMQVILKAFPGTVQSRFFSFLSLDPDLFWRDRSEKSGEYYIQLLRTSRVVRDRVRALDAIQTLKVREAIPALEATFAKDPNPHVRAAALQALSVFVQGKGLVEKISEAVKDPTDIVRLQIIPMLDQLRPKELESAKGLLIPLLDSSDIRIRRPASDLIARLYRTDWEELTDLLLGAEKKSRILGLIETLGKIGDSDAGPLFLQFMTHADIEIRTAAAKAAAVGQMLKKEEWLPSLEDPQEGVRLSAIRGLGRQLDKEVLDIFAKHVEDPSVSIRREVATVLGRARLAGDERPEKLLWQLARDENLNVKLSAHLSLYRMGRTGLSDSIKNIMQNFESGERKQVLDEMKKEGIFVELEDSIRRNRQATLRQEAIHILAALDVASFAHEIAESLTDPSPDVRIAAIEALGQVQDPSIDQKILALLQDPVESVRTAVKRRRLRLAK